MTLDDEEEEEDEDEFFIGRQGDGFGFRFGPDGRHFDEGFSGFFREMDELFKGIGSWDLPMKTFELPGVEPYPYARGQEEEGSNSRRAPRDWMLKQPDRDQPGLFGRGTGEGRGPESGTRPWDGPARDEPSGGPLTPYRRPWNPSTTFEDLWKSLRQGDTVKEDKDLDSRVNSEGLDDILKPSEPKTQSCFKSVSISKVLLPDGTVEERRVTRDSEGNEETRITLGQGEQSYTTVTRRDPQGKEERTEQMVNMDDRDLQRFAERWEHQEGSDALGERQGFRDSLSFLDRLLKGIFSGR